MKKPYTPALTLTCLTTTSYMRSKLFAPSETLFRRVLIFMLSLLLIAADYNSAVAQCVSTTPSITAPACGSSTTISTSAGGKLIYTVPTVNGAYYTFAISTGSSTCGTYTVSPTSVTATGTTTTVSVFAGGTCCWASGGTSATLTYTRPAATASVAGGTTPICSGSAPGTETCSAGGGSGSYSYQWANNAGSISGATSSTYAPGALTASNTYTCTVTSAGCTASASQSISVNALPSISTQPSTGNQSTCAGGTAFTALSVSATGAGLTYQWYSNTTASNSGGTSISGATSSTYTPPNSTPGVTYYYVIVSGTCTPAATSNVSGSFTVNSAPSITTQPSTGNQSTCAGGTAFTALSVSATGAGLTYQWYSNTTASNSGGSSISGATSATYTPPNTTAGVKYYYVIVSGTCTPAATSNVSGSFTVNSAPSITTQPSTGNQSTCAGGTAFTALSVSATGAGLTYQWYSNTTASNSGGSSISGATSASYTPPNGTAGVTYYYVIVSGTCTPAVTSSVSGSFTVNALPAISTQPSTGNQTTCAGLTAFTALSVSATGAGLTYQWYSNTTASNSGGSSISGATSSTYTPPNTPAGVTYYYVIVSGTCTPAVTSNVSGSFTVNAIPNPTFSPTPTSPVCTGVSETYTTQSGQSSYVWNGFGTAGTDYTLISGGLTSTSNTATIQWISTGTKNITIGYSSAGCPSSRPGSATIVVNASPTPTISTSGTGAGGCTGLTLTYTTQSGQSSYVWTFPGTSGTDYTLVSGGNGYNTAVLSYITAGSKTVTVNYTNSSGCAGVTADSNTIVFHNGPTSAALAQYIDPCNGGYTTQLTVTGGTSPFTFELTPPGSYYTLPSPAEIDAAGASSVSISNITDANGCPPASTTGNPVTFGSRGISTGGDSADCSVAAGATQIFYDHSGQLMAKITAGPTYGLGRTGVITTVDGSPQTFGPTHAQHYLQRHFQIVPATSAAATVYLYISDAEANALNTSSSSDVHVAPEYYGTFPVSTSTATAFASGSRIMQYDGSSETPLLHTTETVITSITATHNPTLDGYTYSGVWQMQFAVSGFSGFYVYSASSLSGDNNALPVTLVSFTAQAVDNKFIELDWITASEINNSGFQVERSADGTNYQAIGWVEGHGTSNVQNEYQYSDLTAMPGTVYYYRLKQIDVDGNYAYSNIASASLIGPKGFTVEGLYPNPANSQVSIGVISNISTSATVTMTDMLGRSVLTQNWGLSIGYNTNAFDVSNIANGTYVVTVTSGDVRTSKQLVITR